MQIVQRLFVFVVALGSGAACLSQTNPTFLTNIPKSSTFSWIVTGLAVSGNHLYATEDNGGSADPAFRIFDVSNPALSVEVHRGGGPACDGVKVVGNRAYLLDGGLKILDISNPKQPQYLGGIPTNFVSVAVVYGDFVYMDYKVYSLSNPAAPVIVGSCPVNGPAAFSGKYGYVAWDFGLSVLDVSDPAHPAVVATRYTGWASQVRVSGNYAYLASGTNCGVTVFDISCPTNPVVASCLPTSCSRLNVSGNYLYVLGGEFPVILDASDPTALKSAGRFPHVPVLQTAVAVANTVAYISHSEGISIFSLGGIEPPHLSIAPAGTNSLGLSWPAPSPQFALQQTANPVTPAWETLPLTAVVRGLQNYVEVPHTNNTMYYRLMLQ